MTTGSPTTIIGLLDEMTTSWPSGETRTLDDIEKVIMAMVERDLTTVYDTAFLDSDELVIVRYMDQHPAFERVTFGFAGALSWKRR